MAVDLKDNELIKTKRAGVLLPLFAMRSATDWGIGDMASLKEWIKYLSGEGVKVLQILPIHETAPEENCPYSALSAFAIDPVYLSIEDVPEVKAAPKAQELINKFRAEINLWRSQSSVSFKYIKSAKYKVLWAAYEYFLEEEKAKNTPRYSAFLAFQEQAAPWLVPYCLFRAAKDIFGWASWRHWAKEFQDINVNYLKNFSIENSKQIMFFGYIQWTLQEQIEEVKAVCKEHNMMLFGDIPFGVNFDSADVWANQKKYILDAEIGAPPDELSKDEQKWGLPAYNWSEIMATDFRLWRSKINRACEIYDVFRLDHLVGFFRTWIFDPVHTKGHFDIEDEAAQKERGAKFIEAVVETAKGKMPVGEDLGLIPNYVRQYMKEISLPGYRVLRWEKDNEVFREPRNYPAASLATTSTHDTTTLKEWWETMPNWERANIWEMISAEKTDGNILFTPFVHKAILSRVMGSGSCLAIFPLQDIIGDSTRVNVPGTVCASNWTCRVNYEPLEFKAKYQNEMRVFSELIKGAGR
ncbi:MAG: 4-alpha-glucanotransferase [Elusimicrobiota bacterium]|nr:4-alpha-glucanotransferase [Elusimicrobiota bacterium]